MSQKNLQKTPVMPKATAVWLVENTSLTFKQIADFCGMHELEIKGIADGDVASSVMGVDPIVSGQLHKAELDKGLQNPKYRLSLSSSYVDELIVKKRKKETKYTPIARRQDKPDAIYWFVKNYPSIPDSDMVRLLGTTKTTISAIKEKSHWNMKNIKPRDPVLLGLCTQVELNNVLAKNKVLEQELSNDNVDHRT